MHDLQTSYQQRELRLRELTPVQAPDAKEIHELRSEQNSIAAELRDARSKQLASEASVSELMSVVPEPPLSGELAEISADTDKEAVDLRDQLSAERERRETLEQEVQRLTATGNAEEKYVELWKALQSARSEILVLGHQLADERKSRESFEVALAKLQRESGAEGQATSDFAQRLTQTLKERRSEAERLGEQIKNANEIIVRLKGRLEASGSPLAENRVLADIDKENSNLRDALKTAQEANVNLRAKAEMAERLAEMVYGKQR